MQIGYALWAAGRAGVGDTTDYIHHVTYIHSIYFLFCPWPQALPAAFIECMPCITMVHQPPKALRDGRVPTSGPHMYVVSARTVWRSRYSSLLPLMSVLGAFADFVLLSAFHFPFPRRHLDLRLTRTHPFSTGSPPLTIQ